MLVLKVMGLLLLLAIAVVLVLALRQPRAFSVSRSALIDAPAGHIYPLIVDFHRWPAWSPWEHIDPAMKRTYEGPDAGKGAIYAWEGNRQVGAGRMEITDAVAPERVIIDLHFFKPVEGVNVTEFALEPRGNATQVTWTMRGPNRFVSKLMGVFVNMDQMVGSMFEAGLGKLKLQAEAR